MKLPEYVVTKYLPIDIMYTIFVGVANFHLTLLLINEKHYFMLAQLNNII